MKNDVRGMKRREFRRINESRLYFRHISIDGFSGYAGIMEIERVSEVWKVRSSGGEVVIADAGYAWLQLSPDDGGWWLTVMYDPEDNLKQYYFDITGVNFVDAEGIPGFTDMYLDVVMNPGGDWSLLDMDELNAALESGVISLQEYTAACEAAQRLIAAIDGREYIWRDMCSRAIAEIKRGEA